MERKKIEVLEPNDYVKKYAGDLFRRRFADYRAWLSKQTRKEHERQMRRLLAS